MAFQNSKELIFSPAEHLQHLSAVRKQKIEQHWRKDWSLQIRHVRGQELKQWKSNNLDDFFRQSKPVEKSP